MREAKKSQLVVATTLSILFLVAIILITNLDNFSIPTSSRVGSSANNTQTTTNTEGVLLITVLANLTVLPNSQSPGLIKIGSNGFLNEPMRGVAVLISNAQIGSSTTSNTTNSIGELVLHLPADSYDVKYIDWRLNSSYVPVEVLPGRVTHLTSYLNATAYPIQSISIEDPDFSGWVASWQQTYLLIPTDNAFSGFQNNAFLDTSNTSPLASLNSENPVGITQISISGRIASQNSEWLDAQVTSPISIQSIRGFELLSLSTSYMVNMY